MKSSVYINHMVTVQPNQKIPKLCISFESIFLHRNGFALLLLIIFIFLNKMRIHWKNKRKLPLIWAWGSLCNTWCLKNCLTGERSMNPKLKLCSTTHRYSIDLEKPVNSLKVQLFKENPYSSADFNLDLVFCWICI